ncbi:hypothetical protein [Nocardiopsis rhodophaea]|uniref:hypothetical protein n=1 Tax=Nocardiopsis rhodophaea TaxID=280238 RepID=UPI0031D987AD
MSTDPSRSHCVVALLADIPTTGHLGDARAERFTLKGDDLAARSAGFLDFSARHIAAGRKVVALYPKWHAEEAERAIQFARLSLATDHIAGVDVDIAPLALSLMADQLAYLSPYLPSGLVASLADELPQHMLSGGWMKSVSGLSTIPITLKQHAGSYLPTTTFLAFCTPVKRVGRVKDDNPAPNIPQRPMEPVQILVSAPEKVEHSDFNDQFIPSLGCQMAGGLPEQPLGRKYWGTPKYVEFVAFSAHPQALTHPVKSIRATPCLWCREPISAGVICRFCRGANQLPAGRPPKQGADVPAPPAKTTGEHIRPSWAAQQSRPSDGRTQRLPTREGNTGTGPHS